MVNDIAPLIEVCSAHKSESCVNRCNEVDMLWLTVAIAQAWYVVVARKVDGDDNDSAVKELGRHLLYVLDGMVKLSIDSLEEWPRGWPTSLNRYQPAPQCGYRKCLCRVHRIGSYNIRKCPLQNIFGNKLIWLLGVILRMGNFKLVEVYFCVMHSVSEANPLSVR